jgi:hypothetical protein
MAEEEQEKKVANPGTLDATRIALDMVSEQSHYYERKTRQAFLVRGVLSIVNIMSLTSLSVLLAGQFGFPNIILLALSLISLISFSLLQVVYPDRALEAYRRASIELSELRVKLLLAELQPETDPKQIGHLFDEFQKRIDDVLLEVRLADLRHSKATKKSGVGS